MGQLVKLFEPIKVGRLELKNRLVMAGMETLLGDSGVSGDGGQCVSERTKRWFEERARGGIALITTGAMWITPYFPDAPPYHLGIYSEKFTPGLRELIEVVHAHGAHIVMQIAFDECGYRPVKVGSPIRVVTLGRPLRTLREIPMEVIGASDLPVGRVKPRPLTKVEIQEIVELVGKAAQHGKDLGFDGLELHFGIGGLASQFMSPLTNNRTDEYGDSRQNRMRFILEIIEKVRKYTANEWTVLARIGASDFIEGGLTLEDTKRYAPMLERGGVDALSIIGGWHISPLPIFQMSTPRGVLVDFAGEIKSVVNIPVMVSHRINDPLLAEQILVAGKADLIELGRALVADPDFANKAKEGRFDDIRKCIACCRCFDNVTQGYPIRCTVNPRAGRELEYNLIPAAKPQRVFVIGAGPAGLEATRVAATRGHRVTLFEKQDVLGGKLLVASLPPYKEELVELTKHLIYQVKRAGVEIKLGQEVTTEFIESEKPDVVIVATGAAPFIPDIPGTERTNVITAIDALTGDKEMGDSVIIVGGGALGCDTAEFALAKGKKVTLVEMLPTIGNDITPAYRWVVLQRLKNANVEIQTGTTVEEITENGVKVRRNGAVAVLPGDTIILAVGMKPNRKLFDDLRRKVKVLDVGDCVEPQRIGEALESAFRVSMLI